jgi:hypothetical protein
MVKQGYRAISIPEEATDKIERILKTEAAKPTIARWHFVSEFVREAVKQKIELYYEMEKLPAPRGKQK